VAIPPIYIASDTGEATTGTDAYRTTRRSRLDELPIRARRAAASAAASVVGDAAPSERT
jgi:hypothetical protein